MRTYTFAGGSVSPGFVLSQIEDKRREGETLQALVLGEYGPGSWLVRIPLNNNPDNRPEVAENIVQDAFLLNVGKDGKGFYILSKDTSQANGRCCLIRFLTVGKDGKGNGYVNRITGFRSKALVGGHGRNSGITPTNGTWSDEVWVVHEDELLKVQLAGCDTAFAVRVRNGEPTVEPWVECQPRQEKPKDKSSEPVESIKAETKSVSGNGKGGNPHRMMRNLKGSHVVPVVEWFPSPEGINDAPQPPAPKINLDDELAKLGADRMDKFNARYNRQSAPAAA